MTTATMTLTQDRAAKAPSSLLPPPSQVLTRVGALAVRDTGPVDPQGQTIVLWPSILADYRIYRHPIEAWRGRHRIIAMNGPGHGESGRSPGAFSMSDCGQALGEVLDGARTPIFRQSPPTVPRRKSQEVLRRNGV
jgi:pimeloyl-ACP methyl ester carboxylesterase